MASVNGSQNSGVVGPQVFATTQWTVVLSARSQESSGTNGALAQLCETYWRPLYTFACRQGYSAHDAEDLVQGFFERFLARDFLRDVAREHGRFRSFLLASFRHYAANTRRDQRTQRRGGGQVHIGWEDFDSLPFAGTISGESPEAVFDHLWAETIMTTALQRLREEYCTAGREHLHEAIRRWLASDALPGEYERLAPNLKMSEGALAVAVHRLRRRYRELVRDAVAQTVQSPGEVDAEMRHLLDVLIR
jgi:DNA-directed RNA polymerase specialized sigma24 family protein